MLTLHSTLTIAEHNHVKNQVVQQSKVKSKVKTYLTKIW